MTNVPRQLTVKTRTIVPPPHKLASKGEAGMEGKSIATDPEWLQLVDLPCVVVHASSSRMPTTWQKSTRKRDQQGPNRPSA